jgi:membrane protease YdiL (CAAX protease family)
VVGAPLIEEIFFRGMLLRSLATPVAWVAQAAVFGAAHLSPAYGLGNVGVLVAIGVLGVILGATATRYRRLGPDIATHAWFNLVATLALVAML